MKEIIWKRNTNGGEDAFVGTIKIGSYHYNGIDSKNGTYIVSSLMPQSQLTRAKIFESETAKEMIEKEFNKFVANISK